VEGKRGEKERESEVTASSTVTKSMNMRGKATRTEGLHGTGDETKNGPRWDFRHLVLAGP